MTLQRKPTRLLLHFITLLTSVYKQFLRFATSYNACEINFLRKYWEISHNVHYPIIENTQKPRYPCGFSVWEINYHVIIFWDFAVFRGFYAEKFSHVKQKSPSFDCRSSSQAEG
jgi:hypothetical protein